MAKSSKTSKPLETLGESTTSKAIPEPNTGISESVKKVVKAYFAPLIEAAREAKELATTAKKEAGKNLDGKKDHFNAAEKAVNVYEEILNKNANPLAKRMEKVAAELEKIGTKATESAKSLTTANVAIKTAKEKIAAAELAAENLYDLVRRGWKDDRSNFEKLLNKIGGDTAATEEKIKSVIRNYAEKIQTASDKINEVLLESSKIDAKVISDNKLKELSQKAKTLTDGFKSDITANLEFSKNQLKQTHADFIKSDAGSLDARYIWKITDNELTTLEKIQESITG